MPRFRFREEYALCTALPLNVWERCQCGPTLSGVEGHPAANGTTGKGFLRRSVVELDRNALATFVHVSDLHFGDRDPNSLDPLIPPLLQWTRWFSGTLAHGGHALRQLGSFIDDLTDLELAHGFELIVSGDVTAWGSDGQFRLADEYLGSAISYPIGPGLGQPSWKNLAIPGNHDHWPGMPTIFGPPAALSAHLPRIPDRLGPIPLPNGGSLTFIRINGDADVTPFSGHRLLALGRFESDLSKASRLLTKRMPGEVRILLLHHSWSRTGATLRITDSSKRALARFLRDGEFSVILTGHVHAPLVTRFTAAGDDTAREVLEARCGSTTQKDQLPIGHILAGMRLAEPLEPNSLIVHQIVAQDGRTAWKAVAFRRDPVAGFVRSSHTHLHYGAINV